LTEEEVAVKAERRRLRGNTSSRFCARRSSASSPGRSEDYSRGRDCIVQFEHLAQAARAWGTGPGLSANKRGPRKREKNPLAERVREWGGTMRGLSDGGAGRRDRGAAKKLHSSWESNCNRTSSKTDGDGQRLPDPVFGPIDLRSFGHGAGQFLPMATTRSWSCKGTDSSSGVIGGERHDVAGWQL
jgi:hypothetical protein